MEKYLTEIFILVLSGALAFVGLNLKRTRGVVYELKDLLQEILGEMKMHNRFSEETMRKLDQHIGNTSKAHATIIAKLNHKD